jgi:Domain of Unknown Function with PDB structure (DUF3857)
MKRVSILSLFFVAASISVFAQKKLNQKPKLAEWVDHPIVHDVPPEYNNEPALILQQDVSLDYRFEGRNTNVYYTQHRLVKVLDEKGIVSFNTIGFSVGRNTRVPLIKARTIAPDGKVQDIAKNMIKVTRDEYGHNKIVIAMEGVTRNSEIELLVKEIRTGSGFGSENFQYPVPVLHARFSLSAPKQMVFEEKGYNGFPSSRDTLINNRRHIDLTVSGIPALLPEPHNFYDLYTMRAEYRLINFVDPNYNDKHRLFTWDDLGRSIFDNHYKINDKERAAVNKYLSEIGVHAGGNELENIKKIENGIKTGIVLYPYVADENGDMLDSVISKRAATSTGYIKLFAACFTQALVDHELGLAGDRTDHAFDFKFENWDNLDEYLFYFPNTKKFLSPTSLYLRYPVVPHNLTSSKGIFCLIPPKGIITGSLAEVRTVTPLTAKQNKRDIAAGVTFTEEMDAQIDIAYSFSGYPATDLRTALVLETKDKEHELVEKIIAVAGKPEDIEKYTITNEGFENYNTGKPLEITARVNANHLVGKAGKEYLFNIGEIIGAQPELYTEKKRELPVDIVYPQSFTRTITINIPKGYKVLNPEATRMKSEYVDRKLVPLVSFISDYVLTTDKKLGDKLVVTVTEIYPTIHFAASEYERFREVVNTVADFNKVALIISKTGGGAPRAKAKPKATAQATSSPAKKHS